MVYVIAKSFNYNIRVQWWVIT